MEVNESKTCCVFLPKIITRSSHEDPVSLDGSTLHQQDHIKQDAALSESQQAVQQAAEMG